MALRAEEQQSAELFQKWLERLGINANWEAVKNDPPDVAFTITADHFAATPQCWAVEITGLFQYVDWNGEEVNRKNIEVPLARLCERLRRIVRSSVTTGYIIFGSAPYDLDLAKLQERSEEYITSGRTEREYLDLPEAREQVRSSLNVRTDNPHLLASVQRLVEENCRFSIQAITAPVSVRWGAMLDGSAKIPNTDSPAANVQATLEYALGRILETKLPRLRNVSGYQRKLLLIWSNYFFADPKAVKNILAARNVSDRDVDSVRLIDDSAEVYWVADPGGLFTEGRSPTKSDVEGLAYKLWEKRGRPLGSPEVDWFEAELRLKGVTAYRMGGELAALAW